jgi:hypothetical protein
MDIAELVGSKPSTLACMKQWLARNGWPHAVNVAGVLLAAREYCTACMHVAARAVPADVPKREPNFAAPDPQLASRRRSGS